MSETGFDHEAGDCPARQDVTSRPGQPPEYLHGDCANYVPDEVAVFLAEAEEYARRADELSVPGQPVGRVQLHLVKGEAALLRAKIAAFKADRHAR